MPWSLSKKMFSDIRDKRGRSWLGENDILKFSRSPGQALSNALNSHPLASTSQVGLQTSPPLHSAWDLLYNALGWKQKWQREWKWDNILSVFFFYFKRNDSPFVVGQGPGSPGRLWTGWCWGWASSPGPPASIAGVVRIILQVCVPPRPHFRWTWSL